MLERTAGLEPTPPYGKYGALQSFVRMNLTILYGATAASTSARWHIFQDTRKGRGILRVPSRSLSPLSPYGSELLSASAKWPISARASRELDRGYADFYEKAHSWPLCVKPMREKHALSQQRAP